MVVAYVYYKFMCIEKLKREVLCNPQNRPVLVLQQFAKTVVMQQAGGLLL
jgi:hypothetical protein